MSGEEGFLEGSEKRSVMIREVWGDESAAGGAHTRVRRYQRQKD